MGPRDFERQAQLDAPSAGVDPPDDLARARPDDAAGLPPDEGDLDAGAGLVRARPVDLPLPPDEAGEG